MFEAQGMPPYDYLTNIFSGSVPLIGLTQEQKVRGPLSKSF
jgi:hypothetical protein